MTRLEHQADAPPPAAPWLSTAVRASGLALLGAAAFAVVLAAQHLWLWLGAGWPQASQGIFFLFTALTLAPLSIGLMGRQNWAPGTCRGLLWAGAALLAIHMALTQFATGRVVALLAAAALAVALRSAPLKRACGESCPPWITKFYTYFICSVVGLGMLFPFLWMLSTSLKAPNDVFTSTGLLPVTHRVDVDGRQTAVTFTDRDVLLEVQTEGGTLERIHRRAAHVQYAWYRPIKARFYYLDGEDHKQKVYFRKFRELVRVRVVDSDSPHDQQRIDVERRRIVKTIRPHWANYASTTTTLDENGNVVSSRRGGAWFEVPMGLFFLNSLFVSIAVTIGQVFTSSLAAYAFARLNFPGQDKLFLGYLATMMIPTAVTMIPVFILMRKLNWVDTYAALIVPSMFSAYGTFMLRQFFMSIPKDLEDAASIDGCGLFGIYWRVILPLSKPALATLTTFTFMGQWNNFLWPLIVTHSTEKMVLQVGLQYFKGLHGTDYTLLMAGAVTAIVPVLIVFLMCQRYFIHGIQLGAIKG